MASKVVGEVIWFDEAKGYGFLMVDGLENNLFLHVKNLQEAGIAGSKMKKGTKVLCRIGKPPNPKGANDKCAVDIELAA